MIMSIWLLIKYPVLEIHIYIFLKLYMIYIKIFQLKKELAKSWQLDWQNVGNY